jgi:hypothetical protein
MGLKRIIKWKNELLNEKPNYLLNKNFIY